LVDKEANFAVQDDSGIIQFVCIRWVDLLIHHRRRGEGSDDLSPTRKVYQQIPNGQLTTVWVRSMVM
jgi:hypothetical protein